MTNIYSDLLTLILTQYHELVEKVERLPLGDERQKASQMWADETSQAIDALIRRVDGGSTHTS